MKERHFLVTGVLRSAGISISAAGANDRAVDLQAKVADVVGAGAAISVAKRDDTTLTYRGEQPLAFGVELIKIAYDRTAKRVTRAEVPSAMAVRGAALSSDFIGDLDDDLFIEVAASPATPR